MSINNDTANTILKYCCQKKLKEIALVSDELQKKVKFALIHDLQKDPDFVIDDEYHYQIALHQINHVIIEKYYYKITNLYLSKTFLDTFPECILRLVNLKELDWACDSLISLPENIEQLSQLRVLSLWGNKLKSLPESFGKLTQLEKLLIDWNQLESLPKSMENLMKLRCLDMSNNAKILFLENVNKLTSLTNLRMDCDKLTIDENISRLEPLISLRFLRLIDYKFGSLSSVPEKIKEFKKLNGLSINDCGLTSLDYVDSLTNLKVLDLRHNCIKSLSKSMFELKKLRVLILESNLLTEFPEVITELYLLQKLDIACNQIKSLPNSISKLLLLEELHLEYNAIDVLPESINELKYLKIFSLSGNNLSYLPENILMILKKLYLSVDQINLLTDKLKYKLIGSNLQVFVDYHCHMDFKKESVVSR
jgi:leucine-rich repeat protein SHOC2